MRFRVVILRRICGKKKTKKTISNNGNRTLSPFVWSLSLIQFRLPIDACFREFYVKICESTVSPMNHIRSGYQRARTTINYVR